jgi:DNA-binding transcriptional LysR family regulator
MVRAVTPELTSLRLLVAVERLGSLGQAARVEGISQPAASKRIAVLERTLDVLLIERTARGSTLTPEGLVVANWSRRVLETIDHLVGAVAPMRRSVKSDLRVAASMTIAEYLLPGWLSKLRAADADLHVGLRVANSRKVQTLVLEGEVDIGFVESPGLDRRLTSRCVAHDRLAVVVAPDHPWARRRRPLRREDLAGIPFVVREPGSGTRETLDRILGQHSTEPLLELGSNAAVKGAVLAGGGVTALSVLAISGELKTRQLIEVPTKGVDLRRKLYAVWPKGSKLPEPSLILLKHASNELAETRPHSRRDPESG